jgi:hypothetical protein
MPRYLVETISFGQSWFEELLAYRNSQTVKAFRLARGRKVETFIRSQGSTFIASIG